MAISMSGSGEGPGWVTAPAYSTAAFSAPPILVVLTSRPQGARSGHLDPSWPGSIYRVTRRVLQSASDQGTTAVAAADRLADERAEEPHPIWGNRTRQIIEALRREHWERG